MTQITDRYINCITHNSSESNLLIGDHLTALIDCGMAFCAEKTMQTVQNSLDGKPLDYIFLTHTHYDHIGALPFFREKWPRARVVTSEAGAAVLLKDTPRRVIREFSNSAAKKYGATVDIDYGDDCFKAEEIVRDGDIIDLGGVSVAVLETPGHTRDSLSYYIPEAELLILNETPGVLMPDGVIYPCYLSSYSDTIRSIEKCRRIDYRFLSLAHRGLVNAKDTSEFLDRALSANIDCHDFILGMINRNLAEDDMLELFYHKYESETLLTFQPKEAFYANARATIACTLRE